MAASFAFTLQARSDLSEAYDWYEVDHPGRGKRFLTQVEKCIASISRSPRGGLAVLGNYRRAVVSHFPYIVVYRFDASANQVIIFTVFHTSRDPDDLLRRLPE